MSLGGSHLLSSVILLLNSPILLFIESSSLSNLSLNGLIASLISSPTDSVSCLSSTVTSPVDQEYI